jgi:hypothetical protein
LKQYTWGDTEIDIYRACMAQHPAGVTRPSGSNAALSQCQSGWRLESWRSSSGSLEGLLRTTPC